MRREREFSLAIRLIPGGSQQDRRRPGLLDSGVLVWAHVHDGIACAGGVLNAGIAVEIRGEWKAQVLELLQGAGIACVNGRRAGLQMVVVACGIGEERIGGDVAVGPGWIEDNSVSSEGPAVRIEDVVVIEDRIGRGWGGVRITQHVESRKGGVPNDDVVGEFQL